MKKAIIHIGGHKTGSTSIQKFLFDNASSILKHNVCYPLTLTSENIYFYGQHALAWNIINRKGNDKYGLSQSDIDDSIHKLKAEIVDNRDLILSSEDFAWANEEGIKTLSSILSGYKVYVILYVRRQDEASQALYQTDILYGGQSELFNEWFKYRRDAFDYWAITERWKYATGFNMIVRPYSKDILVNGDVVPDFIGIINQIFGRNVISNLESLKTAKSLNKTSPDSITKIIRYYNSVSKNNPIIPALIKLGSELNASKISKHYQLISPSTKRSVLDSYLQGNLALSKLFLGINSNLWFEDEMQSTDAEWLSLHNAEGSDLLELINETLDVISNMKSKIDKQNLT